jgi:hypothetical protein
MFANATLPALTTLCYALLPSTMHPVTRVDARRLYVPPCLRPWAIFLQMLRCSQRQHPRGNDDFFRSSESLLPGRIREGMNPPRVGLMTLWA